MAFGQNDYRVQHQVLAVPRHRYPPPRPPQPNPGNDTHKAHSRGARLCVLRHSVPSFNGDTNGNNRGSGRPATRSADYGA